MRRAKTGIVLTCLFVTVTVGLNVVLTRQISKAFLVELFACVVTAGTDCPTAPVEWDSQGDFDVCMEADPHHAIGIVEGWNTLPKTPRIIPAAIKQEIPQSDTAGVSLFAALSATGVMSALGVGEDLAEDASPPAGAPIYLASELAETDPATTSVPLILYCVLPTAVIAWLVGMGFLPFPLVG